ncbi:MAG: efflux RND transporter periplasmic adaptor subunit [Bacteroidota bacterium]
MRKRIIIIVIIVIVAAGLVAKLYLNKKQIDADAKPREIKVSVPVVVAEVKEANLDNSFSVTGTFSPAHEITIISQAQGKIVNVNFENGDFMKEGAVLASCDVELLNAQKALAEANFDKCKNDLKKFEDMIKSNAVTQQQVEEMRLAYINAQTNLVTVNKQLEYAVMRAPFSGYITKKFVEKGGMMMPGTPVAEMIDISTLKFMANVAETDVMKIQKNQTVSISAEIFGGTAYDGKIKVIGMKADDARRYPVEVEVRNNMKQFIKSGMFGTAFFKCEGSHTALLIPRTALVGSIKEASVFVIENDKSLKRSIRVGSVSEANIEVLDGLKAGEKVVIAGQINLNDNTSVRITNSK